MLNDTDLKWNVTIVSFNFAIKLLHKQYYDDDDDDNHNDVDDEKQVNNYYLFLLYIIHTYTGIYEM